MSAVRVLNFFYEATKYNTDCQEKPNELKWKAGLALRDDLIPVY